MLTEPADSSLHQIISSSEGEYLTSFVCWAAVALLILAIVTLAWRSTAFAPLNYNLWLVQFQNIPSRRIIRALSMDDANHRDNVLGRTLSTGQVDASNSPNGAVDPMNLLVTQTPSSIPINGSESMEMETRQRTAGEEDSRQILLPLRFDGGDEPDHSNQQEMPSEESIQSRKSELNLPFTSNSQPQKQPLEIRLKFLDDAQLSVKTSGNITVGQFKRQQFPQQVAAGKVIRLIFQGRLLREDSATLASYGLEEQSVVHCHIGDRPFAGSSNGTNNSQQNQSNVGMNTPFDARMAAATGIAWLDIVLLYAWGLLLTSWEWANRDVQVPAGDQSLLIRAREKIRSILRVSMDILFGSLFRNLENRQHQQPVDANFNIGQLFALITFVKFLLLWICVICYPQIADRRSLFLLIMLSTAAATYLFFSRNTARRIR